MIPVVEVVGRDPRIDPKPGDVIGKQLKKKVAFREVYGRSRAPADFVDLGEAHKLLAEDQHGDRVHYIASNRKWHFASGVHLATWVEWAKDAHVFQINKETK